MSKLFMLCALLAVVTSLVVPNKRDDNPLMCKICKDVVSDVEDYEGHDLENKEEAIIASCEQKNPGWEGKIYCDVLVKSELEAIEQALEDPEQEDKSSSAICGSIKWC